MRTAMLAAAAAAAIFSMTVQPVLANDKCHGSLAADGRVMPSQRLAMGAAIWAWKKAVHKRYGVPFTRWHYSADRRIDCWWDGPGRKFWCTANARPCAKW